MGKVHAAQKFIDNRRELIRHVADYVAEAGAAGQFIGVAGLASLNVTRYLYPSPYFSVIATIAADTPPLAPVAHIMRVIGASKADKSFDPETGMVTFKMKAPGWEAVVHAGAPQHCEVEEYEEEVVTPATEETREVKKRYRLKDPACLGQAAASPTSMDTVEQALKADADSASTEELEAASDILDRASEEPAA